MKYKRIIIILFLGLLNAPGFGCTTFVLKDLQGHLAFGKNFDFPTGQGHIHINYRNMEKSSFIRPPERVFTWISKYGSITFNQAGKEFPYGGMNEKGLVIEQMWLQEAKYPEADNRFGLSALQWIQFQLDNHATVEEVIGSDSTIRISWSEISSLHFLVADRSGNSAAIEYIDGKMVVHQGSELPYAVLSNCLYDKSLEYQSNLSQNHGETYNDWTKNSSGRFVSAAEMIDNYDGTSNRVDYSFQILEEVYQPGNTQWSIVYDLSDLTVHYESSLNTDRQIIDLNRMDFSCRDRQEFRSVDEVLPEEKPFKELTLEFNAAMIERVINSVEFLKNTVPEEYRMASARYFETIRCLRE
jgi:choloylglycine hydrolase